MTLIEMAREAKMPYDFVTGEPINLEKLKVLEALIRADQKEKDAKICEESLDGTNADQWVAGNEFQFAAMRIRTQKEN